MRFESSGAATSVAVMATLFSLTTAMQILSVERSCSALQNSRICILDFFEVLWYNVFVNKISRRSDGRDFRGGDLRMVCG